MYVVGWRIAIPINSKSWAKWPKIMFWTSNGDSITDQIIKTIFTQKSFKKVVYVNGVIFRLIFLLYYK